VEIKIYSVQKERREVIMRPRNPIKCGSHELQRRCVFCVCLMLAQPSQEERDLKNYSQVIKERFLYQEDVENFRAGVVLR
jgi:hypothetical protein